MVIVIKKETTKKELHEKMKQIKSSKVFDAKRFAGKVKWGEDPEAFQKRLRDEWQ